MADAVFFCHQPKSAEARTKVEDKLLARQEKRRGAIKAAGIDYEFDGYVSVCAARHEVALC